MPCHSCSGAQSSADLLVLFFLTFFFSSFLPHVELRHAVKDSKCCCRCSFTGVLTCLSRHQGSSGSLYQNITLASVSVHVFVVGLVSDHALSPHDCTEVHSSTPASVLPAVQSCESPGGAACEGWDDEGRAGGWLQGISGCDAGGITVS